MSQALEIEFKNMLSPDEYQTLYQALRCRDLTPIKQENIYFDTKDGKLENKKIGLRVRITDNYVHLTMKQPHRDSKLETTEKLTTDQGRIIKETGHIPVAGKLKDILNKQDIALNDLIIIGHFKTTRYEQKWQKNLIVLDHVQFKHFEDYELEMEVPEVEQGAIDFQQLLDYYKIPKRPSKQKIVRMKRHQPLYTF